MNRVARISPVSSALLMFGIVCAAMFPPLAAIFLPLSWLTQHRYRREHHARRRHAEAARDARIKRARTAQLEMAYRVGSL